MRAILNSIATVLATCIARCPGAILTTQFSPTLKSIADMGVGRVECTSAGSIRYGKKSLDHLILMG